MAIRRLVAAMVGWVAIVGSRPALAQPVNAEALRPNQMAPGWTGGFDASFAVARGNIELLDFGGAGRIQYQTLHPDTPPGSVPFFRQRVLATSSLRVAERDGAAFINQGFAHLRWTGMWHPRIGSDLFVQHQFNEFLRLRARAVTGGGLRLEMVHRPEFMLWGGSGYMFQYEEIAVEPGSGDRPRLAQHRWTNYVTARIAVMRGALLLQSTTYVQPRFDAFADLWVLEEFEVLARTSTVFSFGATLAVFHDTVPPSGVKTTDVRMASTIRLSF